MIVHGSDALEYPAYQISTPMPFLSPSYSLITRILCWTINLATEVRSRKTIEKVKTSARWSHACLMHLLWLHKSWIATASDFHCHTLLAVNHWPDEYWSTKSPYLSNQAGLQDKLSCRFQLLLAQLGAGCSATANNNTIQSITHVSDQQRKGTRWPHDWSMIMQTPLRGVSNVSIRNARGLAASPFNFVLKQGGPHAKISLTSKSVAAVLSKRWARLAYLTVDCCVVCLPRPIEVPVIKPIRKLVKNCVQLLFLHDFKWLHSLTPPMLLRWFVHSCCLSACLIHPLCPANFLNACSNARPVHLHHSCCHIGYNCGRRRERLCPWGPPCAYSTVSIRRQKSHWPHSFTESWALLN